MLCQITSSERSTPPYLNHTLSNLVIVAVSLISQYTCLSITAPTLQDRLRIIEHYYKQYSDATPNLRRSVAKEAWKHDFKPVTTKIAALDAMRSNLVKALVTSDTSQVLVERRQRVEEGITAVRVAGLLKKVEDVKARLERSLQEKQKLTAGHNAPTQYQPASSHKPNNHSTEVIDVDAIKTDDSDFNVLESAPPTRPRTVKDMMLQVEALANEVDDIADFLEVGRTKVGAEVERLIPAWEAVKKEDNEEEGRKDVERMMTELSEAMQAVRDGVETVQSICTYAETMDADEETEMAQLRKERALVRLCRSCYVPVPEFHAVLQLKGERNTQQADLQKVRSEIENAQWELPGSVDQDEFISDIRVRVEYLIRPLLEQLQAAETRKERWLKDACDRELEAKRIGEEVELNTAVADGRRRTNELIANALSTVAMVKKDVRESKRRHEAKQASQWGAGAHGQPRL